MNSWQLDSFGGIVVGFTKYEAVPVYQRSSMTCWEVYHMAFAEDALNGRFLEVSNPEANNQELSKSF